MATEDRLVYKYKAKYNPLSVPMFKFVEPFYWPNGWTSSPSDTRSESWECPFPDEAIEVSVVGNVILVCSSVAILTMTGLIIRVFSKQFWSVRILPLTKRTEYSFSDIILGAELTLDFFQYIAMGPEIGNVSSFLQSIGDAASVDMEKVVNMKEGVFWFFVSGCLGLIGLMLLFFMFNKFAIHNVMPTSGIIANIKSLSDTLLPILGNMGFLPIIVILMEVFVCTETSGDDVSDAFLHKDCFATCWVGDHVYYVSASAIGLMFYIPVAVYMRPKWQEVQYDMNVITLPRYLIFKSAF